MVCKKIQPLHLIYSCVGLFAFFCTLFFGSHSSYATSVTCQSYSIQQDMSITVDLSTICDLSSLSNSTSYYIEGDYSFGWTQERVKNFTYTIQFLPYRSGFLGSLVHYPTFIIENPNVAFTSTSGSFLLTSSEKPLYMSFKANQSYMYNYSVDLTISDVPPVSDCPDCPDCPPIPENPYDQKLDNLTTAVYSCGATLLVIYFLFLLYRIVIKHGGNR